MVTLTATKVLLDQDLRRTHKMRDSAKVKPGQCWVYVNRARTMARAVGRSYARGGGTMLSVWAPKGEVIDVPTLQALVRGFKLTINFTGDQEDAVNNEKRTRRRRAA
jgi:hypothetical protein